MVHIAFIAIFNQFFFNQLCFLNLLIRIRKRPLLSDILILFFLSSVLFWEIIFVLLILSICFIIIESNRHHFVIVDALGDSHIECRIRLAIRMQVLSFLTIAASLDWRGRCMAMLLTLSSLSVTLFLSDFHRASSFIVP